jgi:tetratricopeptide (TPR) repeat protein
MLRRALCVIWCCLAFGGLGYAAGAPAAGALTQDPYNRGCDLMAQGEYQAAAGQFLKALRFNAADTDALNNLAVCRIRLGEYDKALVLLHKVLALNKGYRGAYLNIGGDYILQVELERAVPPTVKARSAGGSAAARKVRADAYYNLGLIALSQGQYGKAVSAFRTSRSVLGNKATTLALGIAFCGAGEYGKGIPLLEKVRGTAASSALRDRARANLAVAYYRRGAGKLAGGDARGATQDFQASTAVVRNDAALMGIGMAQAEGGQLSAAVATFTSVKDSTHSAVTRTAAVSNLERALDMLGGQHRTLRWLVAGLGLILLALFIAALVRASRAVRYRKHGKRKIVLGLIAGIWAGTVLLLEYLESEPDRTRVAICMGVILLAVLYMWVGPVPQRVRTQRRSAPPPSPPPAAPPHTTPPPPPPAATPPSDPFKQNW